MAFPLANAALFALDKRLAALGAFLNDGSADAFWDLYRRCELILRDRAAPRFYLSSLDPGLGKTTAVVVLLRELLRDTELSKAGVLICLSTKREIQDLVAVANLAGSEFAVVTSDSTLNALSTTLPQAAPVLFTTQQMLASQCAGRQFSAVGTFRYCGAVRKLRIWDESMLPARDVVLHADEISRLLHPVRRVDGSLADSLDDLAIDARKKADGDLLRVPRIATDLRVATAGNSLLTAQDSEIADQLILLSGCHVRIRKEIKSAAKSGWSSPGQATVLVGHGRELPEDLAPGIVLDASGRVRRTYDLWAEERGNLVRLTPAVRDYSKLTVHIWDRGAGRASVYSSAGYPQVLQALEKTIKANAAPRWLLVHHKRKDPYPDLIAELQARLSGGISLDSLTWGMHHGTNHHRGCRQVILAGLCYSPRSHYESLVYAASGLTPDRLPAGREDIDQMQLAELLHAIFQAACRGGIRAGSPQDCDLYLMAARNSGIRKAIPALFPGCEIKDWMSPVAASLPRRVREALEAVERGLGTETGAVVRFSEIHRALGMRSSQFNQSIRRHPAFRRALVDRGIEEIGGQRKHSFHRQTAGFLGGNRTPGRGTSLAFLTIADGLGHHGAPNQPELVRPQATDRLAEATEVESGTRSGNRRDTPRSQSSPCAQQHAESDGICIEAMSPDLAEFWIRRSFEVFDGESEALDDMWSVLNFDLVAAGHITSSPSPQQPRSTSSPRDINRSQQNNSRDPG